MPAQTLLIISQVYVPDPASVGQHMHDVASEMVRRGWRVFVIASAWGYDDPSQRYPRRELRDGVEVHRLPLSSFGKSSIPLRLVGAALFLIQATVRALMLRRLDGILVSTSPPMCSLVGVTVSALRSTPLRFWAMDINPDQLVALGRVTRRSPAARLFELLNRVTLRQARAVIALDRYMAERLLAKAPVGEKMVVLPPWPLVEQLDEPWPRRNNPFRHQHGLGDKFVLMYSGNISPSHPISTFLEAMQLLRDRVELVLLFVGGGLGRAEVERFLAANSLSAVRLLPYQPLESLRDSLSAADVHLVSMGQGMVGIVHPCKVYGALAVGRPILLLGPRRCHVGDILERHDVGWQIDHGETERLARTIRDILDADPHVLSDKGRRARRVAEEEFSRQFLRGRFCDVLERPVPPSPLR